MLAMDEDQAMELAVLSIDHEGPAMTHTAQANGDGDGQEAQPANAEEATAPPS